MLQNLAQFVLQSSAFYKTEKKKLGEKEKKWLSPGQTCGCAGPSLHWDFPSYYM
jgi:hypothetical protein